MAYRDISDMLAGLRGDEYISAVRGIAADMHNGLGGNASHFVCSYDCPHPATLIGMHGCGEPGPLVCKIHAAQHIAFVTMAGLLAATMPGKYDTQCTHCGARGVDHIYIADLLSEVETP